MWLNGCALYVVFCYKSPESFIQTPSAHKMDKFNLIFSHSVHKQYFLFQDSTGRAIKIYRFVCCNPAFFASVMFKKSEASYSITVRRPNVIERCSVCLLLI